MLLKYLIIVVRSNETLRQLCFCSDKVLVRTYVCFYTCNDLVSIPGIRRSIGPIVLTDDDEINVETGIM